MKFFNIDQHISVIADIKHEFAKFGHTVDDVCLSGHSWVMNRTRDSIPWLDGDKWCGFVQREDWKRLKAERPELEQYDGFIATYPPIFSMLYQEFNKPVIIQIPIRYEYPCQSDPEAWTAFNNFLRSGVDSGKIILCANNPYDKYYAESFLGRSVKYIPSMCSYTGMRYNPRTDKLLHWHWDNIKNAELTGKIVRRADALGVGYQWQDVAEYKAVVHFPYNVSIMSMLEQYTACVPLLVPTKRFALSLLSRGFRIFEQNSWAATFGRAPGSVVRSIDGAQDPNDFRDIGAMSTWLNHADYYSQESMRHIIYFDSWPELHELAERPQSFYDGVSAQMAEWNKKRQERATVGWEIILREVSLWGI